MQARYQADLYPVVPADGGGGDYLTDGATYEVIEVHTDRSRTSFRVMSDDGTPALFDARGFVTSIDAMPNDWRIHVTEHGTTLGPAEFFLPGFWEAYFDRDEDARAAFMRRFPTSPWRELNESEDRWAWVSFETRFSFRTGGTPDDWPGIREPEDSVTFDLASIFSDTPPGFAASEDTINAEALRAFTTALKGQNLIVLDWQHPSYGFAPELAALMHEPDWRVEVFPNGDYYAFFTEDFSGGTFGHPWEQSLCVIGRPLIETLGASLATWLPVLRSGEWADWRERN